MPPDLSLTSPKGMPVRRLVAISVAVCALGAAAPALQAASADDGIHSAIADGTGRDATPGLYVVLLDDPPLASYDGAQPAYPATRPKGDDRFDASRPAVQAYRSSLLAAQQDVLDAIGNPRTLYRYTTAVNGFAADLSSEQLKLLRTLPEVTTVQRSATLRLAALPGPQGTGPQRQDPAWQSAGVDRDAGAHLVVGVIDSGIWPENPSFDGVPIDSASRARAFPGFTGTCQPGDRWVTDLCDAKLLSARYFVKGFGLDNLAARDYVSPRDAVGHGSHTAAIAAGNAGVAVTVDGRSFGRISGVAPAAGLAVYKACWTAPDPEDDGCSVADTLAAVDRAVLDGVDVISYSITNASGADTDVVEQAFLNAADAGVFISAAAGDNGPRRGTVDHVSPWVTTVAASTHDVYRGRLLLGDGTTVDGAMVSTRDVQRSRLVYAGDVPAPGVDPADAALCGQGSLDADRVEDTIVICDRGVSARIDKGRAALHAGAAAMVLANTRPDDLPADIHALPAIHVDSAARDRLLGYVDRAARPTALLRSIGADTSTAPTVAPFSARGPATASGGDLLKPDVSAPGVNVLSAVAPNSNLPRRWDLRSGTSMSAPYVAGLAALMLDRHPGWSPAAVRSALMTTADPLAEGGPFAGGAGVVQPADVLDPGLVYDTDAAEWRRYLAGEVAGRQLNQPSIAIGRLVGRASVTRTLTHVGTGTETYTAELTGLRGISTTVTPGQVTLAPGESAEVRVSFSAKRAARYGEFARGVLTWRGSAGHVATSPVVVRPEFLNAPADVDADVADGGTVFRARAGVTGTLRLDVVGPVAAAPDSFTLEPGTFDPADPDVDSSSLMRLYFVPEDTEVARFRIDPTSSADDLDLYVYRGGRLIASAASTSGQEQITLDRPAAGVYSVYVNSAASASDATTSGEFTGWVLPAKPSRRLTVGPDPVTVTGGRPFGVRVGWPDLDDGRAWFGYVEYDGSSTRTYLTLR